MRCFQKDAAGLISVTRRSGKKNDTYYLIVGNKNDNQVGQVVLCSSKNLTDWKFETILASNENGDIGTMWECPDFFALKDKHVLICSPQDMKARKYEFHNGHNSVYFLGDYDANRCRFSKEQPHTLDYGMDFYAPQTTELPECRRIMIAWMKSWGCLCDTEFAGLAGNDDISERIGDKRKTVSPRFEYRSNIGFSFLFFELIRPIPQKAGC